MKAATGGPLFREADFRHLWTAGLLSFLIRWLEILVFGVFVYQQTGSAFLVASMTMSPQLREIRWMIEELRVGLFAQALGTAYPVSDVRIYRAMDALPD